MILSHEHRFIFIKTTKTAGTSIEIALSKFCGPKDILTPIYPQADEDIRVARGWRGAQNWSGSFIPATSEDFSVLMRNRQWPAKYWNHMPATTVRSRVGRRVWDSYTKIAVTRNPYEVMVSLWRMMCMRGQTNALFGDWIRGNARRAGVNFNLMATDGKIGLEHVVRYEHLANDLDALSARLGLDERLSALMCGIRAKSGGKLDGATATRWQTLYSDDPHAAALVYRHARKEFEHFGYPADIELNPPSP